MPHGPSSRGQFCPVAIHDTFICNAALACLSGCSSLLRGHPRSTGKRFGVKAQRAGVSLIPFLRRGGESRWMFTSGARTTKPRDSLGFSPKLARSFQDNSPCGAGSGRLRVEIFFSRSEEHTSELQSLAYLVCRLLLEKKKKKKE